MRDLFLALTISSPCAKTNDDLRPSDEPKTLACDGCATPVRDVSAMTLAEVEGMLAQPGGHCVRYVKDGQGKIAIAPDRPGGTQRWLAPAVLSLAVAACGTPELTQAPTSTGSDAQAAAPFKLVPQMPISQETPGARGTEEPVALAAPSPVANAKKPKTPKKAPTRKAPKRGFDLDAFEQALATGGGYCLGYCDGLPDSQGDPKANRTALQFGRLKNKATTAALPEDATPINKPSGDAKAR